MKKVLVLGWMLACSLSYGTESCPSKLGEGDQSIRSVFCEMFTNAKDSQFFVFDIDLNSTRTDVDYDSAHMATLRTKSEELFKKYDIRHSSDTTLRWTGIPNNDLSYYYTYMAITKATALALAQDSNIWVLVWRKGPPSVSNTRFIEKTGPNQNPAAIFDIRGKKLYPVHRPSLVNSISF